MANNTITFDPNDGVAYGVNLTINTGTDFESTFKVLNPNNRSNYDFTGYSGSSQMTKSVSVGSTAFAAATFTVKQLGLQAHMMVSLIFHWDPPQLEI